MRRAGWLGVVLRAMRLSEFCGRSAHHKAATAFVFIARGCGEKQLAAEPFAMRLQLQGCRAQPDASARNARRGVD